MTPFFAPPLRRAAQRTALALAIATAAAASFAGDGHDHGDAPAPAAGSASPRLSAHSDLFELVGVVDGGVMTLYLDRYASNEPVTGAKIEYEAGADKGIAQPQADGTYVIRLAALGKPGELPFSFTVSAGADTDLLAGDLDIHDPHDHASEQPRALLPWLSIAAAGATALAIALVLARKLRAARRRG
jgi:cobalt-zinc-cadmium efflux system membrane fusion protein